MAGPYRDFIPAGEDAGAAGAGFTDFVKPKEPKPVEQPKPVETPKPVEPVKKDK